MIIPNCGVTMNEAIRAAKTLARGIPPISETDISLVKSNPSLSILDRLRITRDLKRYLKRKDKVNKP